MLQGSSRQQQEHNCLFATCARTSADAVVSQTSWKQVIMSGIKDPWLVANEQQ
jgi:ABC-type uncharacterized transport system substrate-binding protein